MGKVLLVSLNAGYVLKIAVLKEGTLLRWEKFYWFECWLYTNENDSTERRDITTQ